MEGTSTRRLWVIEYVNGRQFFGRFNSRWTRSSDVGDAMLFSSPNKADSALQALRQEGHDRLRAHRDGHVDEMWLDVCGGLVAVTEVERVTRVVPPPDDDRAKS